MKRLFLRLFMIPLIPTALVVIYIFLLYTCEGFTYLLNLFGWENKLQTVFGRPFTGLLFIIFIVCIVGVCLVLWWISGGMLKFSEKKWNKIQRWKEKRRETEQRETRRRAREEAEARWAENQRFIQRRNRIPPEVQRQEDIIRFLVEEDNREAGLRQIEEEDPEESYLERIGVRKE